MAEAYLVPGVRTAVTAGAQQWRFATMCVGVGQAIALNVERP